MRRALSRAFLWLVNMTAILITAHFSAWLPAYFSYAVPFFPALHVTPSPVTLYMKDDKII